MSPTRRDTSSAEPVASVAPTGSLERAAALLGAFDETHRELTLELLRSLDPQSPSSPFHPVQETRP